MARALLGGHGSRMMDRWRPLAADSDKTCATFMSPWGCGPCFPGLVKRGDVLLSELSQGVTEVADEVKRLTPRWHSCCFPARGPPSCPRLLLSPWAPPSLMSFSSLTRRAEVPE